jgi:hypothetical protein
MGTVEAPEEGCHCLIDVEGCLQGRTVTRVQTSGPPLVGKMAISGRRRSRVRRWHRAGVR